MRLLDVLIKVHRYAIYMQTLPSIKIKKAANQHFICKSVTMKALGDDMKLENGMILHLEYSCRFYNVG